jgi:hypothetical protein
MPAFAGLVARESPKFYDSSRMVPSKHRLRRLPVSLVSPPQRGGRSPARQRLSYGRQPLSMARNQAAPLVGEVTVKDEDRILREETMRFMVEIDAGIEKANAIRAGEAGREGRTTEI